AFFLTNHSSGGGGNSGGNGNNSGGGTGGAPVATGTCNKTTGALTVINQPSSKASAGNGPFAIKVSGNFTFVSVKDGVEVRKNQGGGVPTLANTVPSPGNNKSLAMT